MEKVTLRNQLQLGCTFSVLPTLMSADDRYLTKDREKFKILSSRISFTTSSAIYIYIYIYIKAELQHALINLLNYYTNHCTYIKFTH